MPWTCSSTTSVDICGDRTQTVVPSAGAGTRTRPLMASRPKPLLPVADRPVVAHTTDLPRRPPTGSSSSDTVANGSARRSATATGVSRLSAQSSPALAGPLTPFRWQPTTSTARRLLFSTPTTCTTTARWRRCTITPLAAGPQRAPPRRESDRVRRTRGCRRVGPRRGREARHVTDEPRQHRVLQVPRSGARPAGRAREPPRRVRTHRRSRQGV